MTYKHATISNPELAKLMDCMEIYALAANDQMYGEIDDAMAKL